MKEINIAIKRAESLSVGQGKAQPARCHPALLWDCTCSWHHWRLIQTHRCSQSEIEQKPDSQQPRVLARPKRTHSGLCICGALPIEGGDAFVFFFLDSVSPSALLSRSGWERSLLKASAPLALSMTTSHASRVHLPFCSFESVLKSSRSPSLPLPSLTLFPFSQILYGSLWILKPLGIEIGHLRLLLSLRQSDRFLHSRMRCVWMGMCVCIHVFPYMCTHMCIPMCVYSCVCACLCIFMCVSMPVKTWPHLTGGPPPLGLSWKHSSRRPEQPFRGSSQCS